MTLDDASTRQLEASNPRVSAWVTANAGTGKTYVLTQRVARLLLDGTEPDKILCLTYTKAAANEMADRLFSQLSEWAVVPDEDLLSRLSDFVGAEQLPASLHRARRLFAQALETPGGLKIQTIHAFCEKLLRRFPLEAGVSPDFEVLDDYEGSSLKQEALDAAIMKMAGSADPAIRSAFALITNTLKGQDWGGLMSRVLNRPALFAQAVPGRCSALDRLEEFSSQHAIKESETAHSFETSVFNELMQRRDELQSWAIQWSQGSKRDQDRAASLNNAFVGNQAQIVTVRSYFRAFLKTDDEPFNGLCTAKILDANPALVECLEREQEKAASGAAKLRALRIRDRSLALIQFGMAVCAEYDKLKAAASALDYADLIEKTRGLLGRRSSSQWVLYKLDGGIDHILVDEAQDTSPDQWDVIAGIAEEFFSGIGARADKDIDLARTLFAVGDEKQSIYSFQGADPRKFLEMHSKFSSQVSDAGGDFSDVELNQSRRSTHDVLKVVDEVFSDPQHAAQISALKSVIEHEVFRKDEPGLVEFWPVVKQEGGSEDVPWDAPLDQEHESQSHSILAGRIATTIRGWLDRGEWLASQNRPIRPSDIFILVQRRNDFFNEVIRALKKARVPVAGSDRLKLTDHIAVMDLTALGRFALLPEDDLNLAVLLKSPFIGFSEDELFEVAHTRRGTLWQEVRNHAAASPASHSARAERFLSALLRRVDLERPFEFFSRALTEECPVRSEVPLNGFQALVARLGKESEDPITEFLSVALDFETKHAPSMQNFVHYLTTVSIELKREVDQSSDEVRVMTVHGSKGLQNRIVFLPDTCRAPQASKDNEVLSDENGVYWVGGQNFDVPATDALRERAKLDQEAEHLRLLYVAMTRAQDRLYLAGHAGKKSVSKKSWYPMLERAMNEIGMDCVFPWGERGKRVQSGAVPDEQSREDAASLHESSARAPSFLFSRARAESLAIRMTPSQLGSSQSDFGSSVSILDGGDHSQKPLQFGKFVHKLLQYLPNHPAANHKHLALAFLEPIAGEVFSHDEIGLIVNEALAVLNCEAWADWFGTGGRAEVPISGTIELGGKPAKISGQIDRLVIAEDSLSVIDYKTNRNAPNSVDAVPIAYVDQMASYRALLKILYPRKEILSFLLWTEAPKVTELPGELLDLRLTKISDRIAAQASSESVPLMTLDTA